LANIRYIYWFLDRRLRYQLEETNISRFIVSLQISSPRSCLTQIHIYMRCVMNSMFLSKTTDTDELVICNTFCWFYVSITFGYKLHGKKRKFPSRKTSWWCQRKSHGKKKHVFIEFWIHFVVCGICCCCISVSNITSTHLQIEWRQEGNS
jgi:hypothetical protein